MPFVSSAQEDAAQNAILATSTNYFLSLHTASPGTTGANEGTDGRKTIQFNASSGGTQTSSTSQIWSSAVGGQTYTHYGIWTLVSGGTFLRGGQLNTPITPGAGTQISSAVGAISLTAA